MTTAGQCREALLGVIAQRAKATAGLDRSALSSKQPG